MLESLLLRCKLLQLKITAGSGLRLSLDMLCAEIHTYTLASVPLLWGIGWQKAVIKFLNCQIKSIVDHLGLCFSICWHVKLSATYISNLDTCTVIKVCSLVSSRGPFVLDSACLFVWQESFFAWKMDKVWQINQRWVINRKREVTSPWSYNRSGAGLQQSMLPQKLYSIPVLCSVSVFSSVLNYFEHHGK